MEYFGYLASIIIGISLGLIGGGGSILTVPILVYLFQINPENATSYSLFIVGATAMVGSYRHYMLGNLKVKSALYFAFPSVISLLGVRKFLLPHIPATLFHIQGFEVPKIAMKVMVNMSLKLTVTPLIMSPVKPIKELIKMINKEVPTACFIGKSAKKSSAGMIKNPPPAPKNPVTKPTKNPTNAKRV